MTTVRWVVRCSHERAVAASSERDSSRITIDVCYGGAEMIRPSTDIDTILQQSQPPTTSLDFPVLSAPALPPVPGLVILFQDYPHCRGTTTASSVPTR